MTQPIVARCFPLEFQKALISRESDYTRLAKGMTRRGYRISKQFIGFIALGYRRVPAHQLVRICETLGLDEGERLKLHRAAALDYGFQIGAIDG